MTRIVDENDGTLTKYYQNNTILSKTHTYYTEIVSQMSKTGKPYFLIRNSGDPNK